MTTATSARNALIQTLSRVGESVAGLDDQDFFRSASPQQPAIAFHVWHVARWMDFYRDVLLGPGTQIWDTESLAARRNLDQATLGTDSTGMGMGDEASALLVLPDRAELMDYSARTIEALKATLTAFTPEQLEDDYVGHLADTWRTQGLGTVSVGATTIAHLTHANRHLGMIEALRGTMGQTGSATV